MDLGSKNLIKRTDNFSFYIKLPTDVQYHFNNRKGVVRSLHTSKPEVASQIATSLRSQFNNAFVLLRTGILDDEQRLKLVNNLLGVKEALTKKQVYRLAEIFSFYIKEKSDDWNADTKQNFERNFQVILAELGNKPIEEFTRVDTAIIQNHPTNRAIEV